MSARIFFIQFLGYFLGYFLSKTPPQYCRGHFSGGRGIRTPGALQHNSFQDCRHRPLGHSSKRDCKGSKKLFLCKELPVKENQIDSAHGDATVCKVEHRLKENVAADKGDPGRPGPEREIEHIHHLALHKGGVRAQRSHRIIGGFAEDEPIAKAIHNIAESPGRDEGKAHQHAHGNIPSAEQFGNPPAQHPEEHYTERGEQVLPHYPAERHAKGHALVLYKEQLEPVSQHRNAFPERHVRLDQDLDDLVNHDQRYAHKE